MEIEWKDSRNSKHWPAPKPVAQSADNKRAKTNVRRKGGTGSVHESDETDADSTGDAVQVTVSKAWNQRDIASKYYQALNENSI